MKVSYKRDMSHNYMILEPPKKIFGEEYQIKMLEKNQIPGLLNCRLKKMDGQILFYYEVTSKQSLIHSFDKDVMDMDDIARLMTGIKGCLEQVSLYLLDPDSILLAPEFIYTDVETNEVFLCCLPGYDGEVTQAFRELSEYILKTLNHNDTRAVTAGYEIYRQSAMENYSIVQVIQSVYQVKAAGKGGDRTSKTEEGVCASNFRKESGENHQTKNLNGNSFNESDSGTQSKDVSLDYDKDGNYRVMADKKASEYSTKRSGKNKWSEARTHKKGTECRKKGEQRGIKSRENASWDSINLCNKEAGGRDKLKNNKKELILTMAIGVVLTGLTTGTGILFDFSLTQTGGIFFLVVGAYSYIVTSVGKRKSTGGSGNKSKNSKRPTKPFRSDWIEEFLDEEQVDTQNHAPGHESDDEPDDEPDDSPNNTPYKTVGTTMKKEPPQEQFGETSILNDCSNQILSLISLEPSLRENIILSRDSLIIGKVKSKVDVVIELPVISRIHARIYREEENCYVEDLNSRNGTYLNGERLEANEKRKIEPSDEISFAGASYYVGRVNT